GKSLVNESGEALNNIMVSVKEVSDLVAEIATASEEQSLGISEVNRAVAKMDEMTQQNAALVEEVASTSDAMGRQAAELAQNVDFFKVDSQAVSSGTPAIKPAASKPAPDFVMDVAAAEKHNEPPAGNDDWSEF
ncbi:MAG: hypothetical protein KAG18_02070, partial [Sinobacterium sp.]|nr:hypothetical protein [Sinobacterium sp.]